ncbi:MAG: hypothetical protein V4568_00390 [Pseudomonadota bacterium]
MRLFFSEESVPLETTAAAEAATESMGALLQELEDEVRKQLVDESRVELEDTKVDPLFFEPVVMKEKVVNKGSIETYPMDCDATDAAPKIVVPQTRWSLRQDAKQIPERSETCFITESTYPIATVNGEGRHDKALTSWRRIGAWVGLFSGISAITAVWYLNAYAVRTTPNQVATFSTASQPITAKPVIKTEGAQSNVPVTQEKSLTAVPEKEKILPSVAPEKNEAPLTTEATPSASAPRPAAPASKLIIAVSPWGKVYVDGKHRGVSPPLTELMLSPGEHQVEIRNTDLPPYQAQIRVHRDHPFRIKHKFE